MAGVCLIIFMFTKDCIFVAFYLKITVTASMFTYIHNYLQYVHFNFCSRKYIHVYSFASEEDIYLIQMYFQSLDMGLEQPYTIGQMRMKRMTRMRSQWRFSSLAWDAREKKRAYLSATMSLMGNLRKSVVIRELSFGCIVLKVHINGLVQDCSISSALAMEILQSCTEPWI